MPLNSLLGRLPAGYTFLHYARVCELAFGALVLDVAWAVDSELFQAARLIEKKPYKGKPITSLCSAKSCQIWASWPWSFSWGQKREFTEMKRSRISKRFFIYEKVSKKIVSYCDKKLGLWCLDQAKADGARLALGWKQIIRHPPDARMANPITITYVYPHDASSTYDTL